MSESVIDGLSSIECLASKVCRSIFIAVAESDCQNLHSKSIDYIVISFDLFRESRLTVRI